METFTASDGRRLAFTDSRTPGPAVLCLAGLSRNSRDFDDLAVHLAPRHRVLRLDSRGRGGSERAVDPHVEYTVPVEAGDAIALLDHLAIERVALIGTSRGGVLSMAIAGAQPARVSAVVLNDIGAVIEGRGLARIIAALGQAPTDASFEAAAERLMRENAAAFPDAPLEEWRRHAARLYDDADGRPALAYDPRLRDAVAGAIPEADAPVTLWPLFEALKSKPALVIRGENSDILSAETVADMQAAHPRLGAVTALHRGHPPFLNEPAVVAAVTAFLDAHGSGGGAATASLSA